MFFKIRVAVTFCGKGATKEGLDFPTLGGNKAPYSVATQRLACYYIYKQSFGVVMRIAIVSFDQWFNRYF